MTFVWLAWILEVQREWLSPVLHLHADGKPRAPEAAAAPVLPREQPGAPAAKETQSKEDGIRHPVLPNHSRFLEKKKRGAGGGDYSQKQQPLRSGRQGGTNSNQVACHPILTPSNPCCLFISGSACPTTPLPGSGAVRHGGSRGHGPRPCLDGPGGHVDAGRRQGSPWRGKCQAGARPGSAAPAVLNNATL